MYLHQIIWAGHHVVVVTLRILHHYFLIHQIQFLDPHTDSFYFLDLLLHHHSHAHLHLSLQLAQMQADVVGEQVACA